MGLRHAGNALRQIRTIRERTTTGGTFLFVGILLYLRAHAHNSRLDAVHKIFKAHRQGGRMKANRRVIPGVQFVPRRDARSDQPSGCADSDYSDRNDSGSENSPGLLTSSTLFGHEASPIGKSRPTRWPSRSLSPLDRARPPN